MHPLIPLLGLLLLLAANREDILRQRDVDVLLGVDPRPQREAGRRGPQLRRHRGRAEVVHVVQQPAHEVADEDGRRISEERICRGLTAAQPRFIDHVVVQERRGVDKLHHRGKLAVMLSAITARVRREDQEHRPQPLTPATYDVVGNFTSENDLGLQASTDDFVHRPEIVGYELA